MKKGGFIVSLWYDGKKIGFAKKLRKEATKQENHLWYDFLSRYPIRFQRQKTIDRFIADFYCHRAHLVIEIDGAQHASQKGMRLDQFRTERLEGHDLQVIRFTNEQIDKHFYLVCQYIDTVVQKTVCEREG